MEFVTQAGIASRLDDARARAAHMNKLGITSFYRVDSPGRCPLRGRRR